MFEPKNKIKIHEIYSLVFLKMGIQKEVNVFCIFEDNFDYAHRTPLWTS